MNSQHFYLINFFIFVALALFFWLGRSKAKQPTKLDLSARSQDNETAEVNEKSDDERMAEARDVAQAENLIESAPKLSQSAENKETAIYFVYNGHEWEAYEVLGLPRGSTLATTTSHYQHLVKTADPSTFEFYEAAYFAILKTKS